MLKLTRERLKSPFPLIQLGTSTEFFTQEDLEGDIHILGAKGEGKSKLLELLLRYNIDNDRGGCLLDPSDGGDTCYKVLKYALSKGYEKVILIDPHDISPSDPLSRVPVINPLHYRAPAAAIVGNLMDATRILWGQKDSFETPRIQKYLPAIITALQTGHYCLPDAECLMDRDDVAFKNQRNSILYHEPFVKYHRLHHAHVVSAFKSVKEYDGYLPTVNRLMPFMDATMKLLFGLRDGLNFQKLIADRYLVLVNLDPEGVWGTGSPEQRLLGTIIINEITYAISRLRNSGWKGVYYLYIDEAGDYATSKLSYILDKKRKSGLRLTLSHQRFDQFSDKDVSSAVYGGTKIKVLFNTPSRDDRDRMIRMMFGGELSDREVSFHLQDTEKANCWIKNNKQKPQKVHIRHLPDIEIKKTVLTDFKKQLYASDFYKSVRDIRAETLERFGNRTAQGYGGASVGTPGRYTSGNTKEPPRDDGNPVVEGKPVDDQKGDRGNGTAPLRGPAKTKPKRKAGLLPPQLPKHK